MSVGPNQCPSCGARYNIWCVGLYPPYVCNTLECGKCKHRWKKERIVIATIMESGKLASATKSRLVEAIAEQEEEGGEQYITDLLNRAAKAQQQACDFIEMAAQYVTANAITEGESDGAEADVSAAVE